jgi:hypothetical protein
VLAASSNDGIEIDADGAHERVAYDDIVASHTVFEWGPAPKPGKSTKSDRTASKPTVPAQG